MDAEIVRYIMPPEYANKKMVMYCNDCGTKSCLPYHFFGGKCKNCRSYNTTRVEDPAAIQRHFEEHPEEIPEDLRDLEPVQAEPV